MTKDGASYAINLEQGEMIRIDMNDQISVIIRYTSDSPKPLVAPFLDLTASEFTGVVLAGVLIAILRLYTFLYTPPVALPGDEPEPPRIALIATPTPIPPIPPPQPKEVSTPAPTPPPPVVKATPQPKPAPVVQQRPKAKTVTNLTAKQNPGRSAKAAPNPDKTARTKVGSVKQGGAIKQTKNQGSQMNSKRDKNKEALFSAFGGGGAQDKLSKSQTGAGELAGMANAANGKSGFDTNRAGVGLGAIKNTGAGDSGKALEAGIRGGIGTTGRGSGNSGYGTGGLGKKSGTRIVTGGQGESFSGTIDREAIRRVLKANERTIRTCYERQLNRNPDLFGKLVLTWDITEGGRATNVHVGSNELGNQEVANCIMDHLKNWKFPDPPANQTVEVSYPWFFSN
jgi:outer membrane biosynthesis protein TonB